MGDQQARQFFIDCRNSGRLTTSELRIGATSASRRYFTRIFALAFYGGFGPQLINAEPSASLREQPDSPLRSESPVITQMDPVELRGDLNVWVRRARSLISLIRLVLA